MMNIFDFIGQFFLTLLLAVSLHGMLSNGSGPVNVILTTESTVISERQNVTLHCMVSGVDHGAYKIEWGNSSLQDNRETLQSSRTAYEDTTSRTLSSSLTLSTPGPNFIASLYVCEVHSIGRGGSLATFAHSSISRRVFERRLECSKSGDQGKVIYLFQGGPPVTILCKVMRLPIVELRWKALYRAVDDILHDERNDNGVHRYINSTLRWDPRLNDLILYCKAWTYTKSSAPVEPCVIGLVKVVQQPRIIPSNTSISFGLVNEAEFWCDVRGLSRQSCSYMWTCEPMVPGCHGNSDTVVPSVNETTRSNEIKVTCHVHCTPDVAREAHATLTIQSQSANSAQNSLQSVAGLIDHKDLIVELELYSESEDGYVLQCVINLTEYQPIFTWYIDGERVISNIDNMMYQQETHSNYRIGHSFQVVVCEVLLNTTIIRVWDTFTQLIADVMYTSPSHGAITTGEISTVSTSSLSKNSVLQPSDDAAIRKSGFFDLPASSRLLLILLSICGSMAVLVFLWIAVSTLKQNSAKWAPTEPSKTKTVRTKPQHHAGDSDTYLTPISGKQKNVSADTSDEYTYPAYQKENPNEIPHSRGDLPPGFESNDGVCLNERQYEEIPGEEWRQYEIPSHVQAQGHQHSSTPPSSSSYSSSSSSSCPSSSPPLIHEYDTGHGFISQDSQSLRHNQLHHIYLH